MKFRGSHLIDFVILLFVLVQFSACSTNHGNPEITGNDDKKNTISGTVAVGSPVVGTVYLKNATTGESLPSEIDENGRYSIELFDYMTGPYILQVKGTAGGRYICLHSLGTRADVSATVNITPMTHLITGNVLKSDPEQFFDSFNESVLTKAATEENIRKQEKIVKQRFKNVLVLFGVDMSNFNLVNTPFNTDHSEIDGVLDVIRFETLLDENGNRQPGMAARLVYSDDEIVDDFTRDDDVSELPMIDGIVADTASIASVFEKWVEMFKDDASNSDFDTNKAGAKSLPVSTDNDLMTLFSEDFFQNGRNRTEFLEKICSFEDSQVTGSLKNMAITGLSFDQIDFINGEAQVTFSVSNSQGFNEDQYHWNMVRSGDQWMIRGNQQRLDCFIGAYSAYSKTTLNVIANGLCVFAWTPFADRISDIHHIVVTGYGIPTGYTLSRMELSGGILFVSSDSAPKGYCMISDPEKVRFNEEYVFSLYGNDGNPIPGAVYKQYLKMGADSRTDLLKNKNSYFCNITNPLQTLIDAFNDGPASLPCEWTTPSDMILRETNYYYTHSGFNAVKRKIYPLESSGATEYFAMIYEKNITRLDIYVRSSDVYGRIFDSFISDSHYAVGTQAKDIIIFNEEGNKPFRIF